MHARRLTCPLDIVILGLSITSSWGNGHATTYRGLVRELVARGNRVRFLERDVPWYAQHGGLPERPGGGTRRDGSRQQLARGPRQQGEGRAAGSERESRRGPPVGPTGRARPGAGGGPLIE